MGSRNDRLSHASLSLERLESRLVPDAASYVRGLYADVLHRQAESEEAVNFWAQQVQAQGHEDVAAAFVLSEEHRALHVSLFYQRYFNRTPSQQEVNIWVNDFRGGEASEKAIQEELLASEEYRNTHATDRAFVEGLYEDVLRRGPGGASEQEINFWVQQLQDDDGDGDDDDRRDVIEAFLNSDEHHTRVVEEHYCEFLHREPDQPGLQSWVAAMRDNDNDDDDDEEFDDDEDVLDDGDGLAPEAVAVRFLSSQEYIQRHDTDLANHAPLPLEACIDTGLDDGTDGGTDDGTDDGTDGF